MATTPSEPSRLNQDQIKEAGVRYQERVAQKGRDKAPPKPPARTAYLARTLALTKASSCVAAAEAAGAPATSEEAIAQLSQERIIGSTDLVGIETLELAIAVSRAVARIQIGNEFGTGALVGPGLLMTNNHVIGSAAQGQRAVAQFDYQVNTSGDVLPRQDFRVDPGLFFATSPELDFTIVGVTPRSSNNRPLASYGWLKLIAELGKAATGDPLNIIQHPRGGLKQIALRNNEVIDIPEEKRDFLYYTTDTEPGSSGSPCFNDQWEIVALHHMGVPELNAKKEILKKDHQPWKKGVDPEALISWIANEGARVSAIVSALRAESLQAEWRDLRDLMLESPAPNPIELARSSVVPEGASRSTVVVASPALIPTPAEQPAVQSATFTIPLQFTITLGGVPSTSIAAAAVPAPIAPTTPRVIPAEALGAEVTIDPDFANREGYDPAFLGVEIPLPELSAEQQAITVEVPPQFRKDGRKFVLNYHHYSVVMNQKRRTAWYSAGMIDGKRFRDFKRGRDKWFLDARISPQFQMGEELYAAKNTDRGHLTRFKDLSWGAAMDEAVNATNDSFHFTNCTLQLDNFNQGKDRWQGLELFLLEQHARKDKRRLVVMTGPLLRDSDPAYRNPSMDYTARIPLAFWKVCALVRESDGQLSATAFTLGQQDITDLPGFEEKFDVGAAQITVAELEELTGLHFGTLREHDHFAESDEVGTLEIAREGGGKRRVRPIGSFTDIVV